MAKPAVPKKRRGKFVRTPVRRELGEILSKRGEEREKALLECEDLEAVVPMIPPEELFFTLREMDTDNIPLVLAHARTEQVQFLLDIELWQKDRVRPDRIARWIELLASCGETSLPRWLRGFEVADLALLLGQDVKVHLTEPDREPLQEIPGRAPFTLDGVHYISAPERLEPVVRAVLLSLREAEPGRYHRLVESLIRDVDSELEEHCYQERQKRLAERGFPEWEEAMQVYARLDVEDAGALPVRSGSPTGDSGDGPIVAPRYPVAFADAAPDLLARALRHIEDWDAREAVRAELAYLTNKVLVADGLELDRVDSFDLGLQKVASYTSIGLEVFCGYEEEKAAQVLRRSWMQSLFRVGWTRVRRPRARARRLFYEGWPQGHKERLLFLDSPLPEILDGLLRRTPLWYAGEGESSTYRLFRTLSEAQQAECAVEKADFLGRFLLSAVELRLGDLKEALIRLDTENLKGSTVFLTSLVNASLGREFRFAPIERTSLGEGLASVWVADRPPRRVKPELADSSVEWSKTVAAVSEREDAYLREFVDGCFVLLEEQFGHLAIGEIPDPRFTRGIWIE